MMEHVTAGIKIRTKTVAFSETKCVVCLVVKKTLFEPKWRFVIQKHT
jgi:hypothetical protein